MADRLAQIEAFVNAATRGSLSAAARQEGVTPAVIGRRLDALEAHLGVRLLVRSTRRLSLTFEGQSYLEDCQRLLGDLASAEAAVMQGGLQASGHMRISAPAGFGRRHVVPVVARFMAEHPGVQVTLDLSDRVVDLVNEGVDCAVRIGEMPDSSLVGTKLGEMRRAVVASPEYLARCGVPQTPSDLARHECLSLGLQRGWMLRPSPEAAPVAVKIGGRFACNDGTVLHEWAVAGAGLAWRSLWEVGADLRAGRLGAVLEEHAPPPLGIYALYPQRRHLPLRVRLFVEALRAAYAQPECFA